jgi:hypothetical protein
MQKALLSQNRSLHAVCEGFSDSEKIVCQFQWSMKSRLACEHGGRDG